MRNAFPSCGVPSFVLRKHQLHPLVHPQNKKFQFASTITKSHGKVKMIGHMRHQSSPLLHYFKSLYESDPRFERVLEHFPEILYTYRYVVSCDEGFG